jgi:DNA-binding LacI/PurR family transcriptional regulator
MVVLRKSFPVSGAEARSGRQCREPLYRRLAAVLRRELADGRYDGRLRFPSQNELARRFAVAPNTAREAVALLVQEGLLEKRFGSGTYRTGRKTARYIGVVTELDIAHAATSPFFLDLIQSVRRRLAAAGHESRLYVGHTPPFAAARPARITAAEFRNDLETDVLRAVIDIGSPAGMVAEAVGARPIPVINASALDGRPFVDYGAVVRLGVTALAERGCRAVACIDLEPRAARGPRLDAFAREAARLGLRAPPAWQVATAYERPCGHGAAAFRRIWETGPGKPDGLLVLDDILYRDLAPLLLLNGIRVPGDLVVASHANRGDARPLLPLPVQIAIDADEVGAALVGNLLARLNNPGAPACGIPVPVHVIEPSRVTNMLLSRQPPAGDLVPA